MAGCVRGDQASRTPKLRRSSADRLGGFWMIKQLLRRTLSRFRKAPYDWRHDWRVSGHQFAASLAAQPEAHQPPSKPGSISPLEAFFEARREGPGIWKWRHYFDLYHRHLSPLRGRDKLVIIEIGIYSGGSLDMWRDYFGDNVEIYGIDIEPACLAYQRPGTHVLIGDQGDPLFWKRVLADGSLPAPDIVIDDGGHTPEQQRTTMEALLPVLKPGGVYICEDIHGADNPFSAFVSGFADQLSACQGMSADLDDQDRRLVVPANATQALVHSLHLYPFVVVVERHAAPIDELVCPKRGSQWEPFL